MMKYYKYYIYALIACGVLVGMISREEDDTPLGTQVMMSAIWPALVGVILIDEFYERRF